MYFSIGNFWRLLSSPFATEITASKTVLTYLRNATSKGKPKQQGKKGGKGKKQQNNKKEEKQEEEKKEETEAEKVEEKEETEKEPEPLTPPFNVIFALEVISFSVPTNTKEAAELIPVVEARKVVWKFEPSLTFLALLPRFGW